MDTSIRLNDKTAIISGACSSIGRATALRLTECGCNVALVDSPSKSGDRLVEEISNQREVHERRGRAGFIPTSYKDTSSVQDVASRSAEMFGGIDIFVDANMFDENLIFAKDFSLEKLDESIQINLRSTLLLTHKICEFLKGRKKGRIIYLIQDLHRIGFEGDTLSASTRTGLIHFTKGLAKELFSDNVTVNCLAVGPTEEYILKKKPGSKSLQGSLDEILKSAKPNRIIEPNEIANAICFLASPMGSAITGQTISVSGGLTFLS